MTRVAVNTLILLIVPIVVLSAFLASRPSKPRLEDLGIYFCFHDYADASVPAPKPETVDKVGVPKSWHSQIEIFLNGRRPGRDDLPADIMALPDLSGGHGIPNLREAVFNDRNFGSGRLFSAVKRLQGAAAGDALRAEMRNILFLWLDVADDDPATRGWFIDARELSVLEKLGGEKFVQAEWFPNPMPMAATALKDIFRSIVDYYAAMLLNRAPPGKYKLDDWVELYGENMDWRDRLGRKVMYFYIVYRIRDAKKRHRYVCYLRPFESD